MRSNYIDTKGDSGGYNRSSGSGVPWLLATNTGGGEERGGRGGRLPSSPSDRERRVGSSHGLNWAPIPDTHTHTDGRF